MDEVTKFAENRLMRAVRLRKLTWVRNRLAEGMDPNWMDTDPIRRMTSKTPLIQAIRVRDASIAKLLLEHGADPNLECSHTTPLLEAAQINSVVIVTMLLEAGADFDHANNFGDSAETVCFGPRGEEVKRLVAAARARRAIDAILGNSQTRKKMEIAYDVCH